MLVLSEGGIYLANVNPSKGSEPGRIRPCLVMQSDLLDEAGHRAPSCSASTDEVSVETPL